MNQASLNSPSQNPVALDPASQGQAALDSSHPQPMAATDSHEPLNRAHKPYVYVFIREDISAAQQLVQVGHAALEAGFAFEQPSQVASLIVLSVPDRESLLEASRYLEDKSIEHHLFFEPDFDMGHSALATRPIACPDERGLLRHFPLFGKKAGRSTASRTEAALYSTEGAK